MPKNEPEQRRSTFVFNKKKYAALQQELQQIAANLGLSSYVLETLHEGICRALAFDPNLPVYSKEQLQKMKTAFKQKLAENNMNSYDAYGRSYYNRNRETCIEKVSACKKSKRDKARVCAGQAEDIDKACASILSV